MKFRSFSTACDLALERFFKPPLNTAYKASLQPENLSQCPYEIYLISESPPDLNRIEKAGFDAEMLLELHHAWRILTTEFQNKSLIETAFVAIGRFGRRMPVSLGKLFFRIWQFSSEIDGEKFFLLLKDDDTGEIMGLMVRAVLNLWQLKLNKIPLHSCGIIYDENLYLFLGPSGAGKSTVAALSNEIGREVLDEDQLMIYKKDDNTFTANAWGYSLRRSNIPIRGFFKIFKDTKDDLIPIAQTHTTCLLMEQAIALTGYNLPGEELKRLFKRISELARSVPGYELHFRKAPDFWKLIDEEFSR